LRGIRGGRGYGHSLIDGLRVGLFLLRAGRQVAGYHQQTGTNKAVQKILHLRLMGSISGEFALKADFE
jgi:hypothetical protein